MAARVSKSRMDRLGERIKRGGRPSREQLEVLDAVRLAYDDSLHLVAELLRVEIGLRPTTRLKTFGTIVDKLRRSGSMRFSQMHDIAGVRVVRDMDADEQDRLVARITELFPGSRLVDRRERPTHGYRAVHVIADVLDRPVEIQVRTRLQDQWAQILERVADAWGRQIRYGGTPDPPPEGQDPRYRVEMLGVVLEASRDVARFERDAVRGDPPMALDPARAELWVRRARILRGLLAKLGTIRL